MKPLEQSIIKTLAYFDLLNFPLTQEELFRFLWVPPRMGWEEFKNTLNKAANELGANNYELISGYYFLPGRESLVVERQRAAEITEQKLKKARRAAKLIRSVPFLRAIFVCNSVGAGMARQESDIDFFIVTEKRRIWIVRLFTNIILRLFGLRTYGAHQADRICLSFYVDTGHLDLAPWRVCDDDIHFAYWLNMMTSIYDPENYYEKFLQANKWTEKFLPNILSQRTANHPYPSLERRGDAVSPPARGGVGSPRRAGGGGSVGRIWKKIWEAMWRGSYGDIIEREAKKVQLTKMRLSLQAKAKLPDHGVVITDGVIKLHENDTRLATREKWLSEIKSFGLI